MGPLQRALRRALNPVSTGLTRRWIGSRRQVPVPPAARVAAAQPGAFRGVASPGDWTVPDGLRPGWQWLPDHGARPNLRAMPRWARIWYRTPWVDRYAFEWMWWHGAWSVLVPADPSPPTGPAGVREPRRPTPNAPDGAAELPAQ